MKIAFIGTKGMNFDENSFGGFETVVTELAPRFVANGHEVTIYCRKKLYKSKYLPNEIQGVKLKYYNGFESKNLGTMTNSLISIIDSIKSKTQLVFLFNIGLGIYIPLLKLFNIKIVTNLDGVEWERSKWSNIAKLVFKFGALLNVRYSDILISDAEAIKNLYLCKYKRDSIVIQYGAEISNDLRPDRIKSHGLTENGYYLLVTRFIPENNPLFIIKNFLKTKTDKPLVVLGRNYYSSKYENKIKQICDSRIIFLGHINERKLLLEFYRYSYVYIHGHSVGGTNPTMLEAMANNCCILALNTVFNQEMLVNGKYGLFYELNEIDFINKIEYLEHNNSVVSKYKEIVADRIREYYNWLLVLEKYKSLLLDFEIFSEKSNNL